MALVKIQNVYNANEVSYVKFESSFSFGFYTALILTDQDGNKKEYGDSSEQKEITQVEYDDILKYIKNNDIVYPNVIKITSGDCYIVIPANYCKNGNTYTLEITFIRITTGATLKTPQSITLSYFSDPIIQLDNYAYSDGNEIEINNTENVGMGEEKIYNITIKEPFCKLNFSYTQKEGDGLKYYQFSLYDKNGKFLGNSEKKFLTDGISYSIENYNNLQQYALILNCVTQHNNAQSLIVYINTDYSQDNVYANITFMLDKEKATNNVTINISQLTGSGEKYSYDSATNNGYVVIPDDGYVNFTDVYQVITKNFLCRLWCKNLSENIPILKITQADGNGYVEIFFSKTRFYAYKYSCGLKTSYVSNDLEIEEISTDTNIYLSVGYYNGRIEMYTTVIHTTVIEGDG